MYFISSKDGNKYGVIDTQDGVEEFYTLQELRSTGINIVGLPKTVAKSGIVTGDFVDYCNRVVVNKGWFNRGYSSEQARRKREYMHEFLLRLKSDYPNVPFSLNEIEWLGYYDGYSDFQVCYDDVGIVGIGTHAGNIKPTKYRAEFMLIGKELEAQNEYWDVDLLRLDIADASEYIRAYRNGVCARRQYKEAMQKMKSAQDMLNSI